jgi:hypothetical protein
MHLLMCDEVVDEELKTEIKNIDFSDLWASFAKQKCAWYSSAPACSQFCQLNLSGL